MISLPICLLIALLDVVVVLVITLWYYSWVTKRLRIKMRENINEIKSQIDELSAATSTKNY
mgnify:CR=1 FL=1